MAKGKVSEPVRQANGWRAPGLVALGTVMGIGVAAAWLLPQMRAVQATELALEHRQSAMQADVKRLVRASQGKLTHPLLTCSAEPKDSEDLLELRGSAEGILAAAKAHGVTRAAVHVSDLETCHWFEIGGAEQFQPASMLKLPLALAWLRRASIDASVLTQGVVYTLPPQAANREDNTGASALVTGQNYTIADLLRRMLVDSRNDAKWALSQGMPSAELDAVWLDLGMQPPPHTGTPLLRAKDMALILHALYDGAWLGRNASEKALGWLAEASFHDGLAGALPSGAVVAHKFGRRLNEAPVPGGWQIQLHDCGILYRSGHPMLACMMTEGTDEAEQARTIQQVAALLWNYPQVKQ